jgi:beta-barrel assembly-enhancing protease
MNCAELLDTLSTLSCFSPAGNAPRAPEPSKTRSAPRHLKSMRNPRLLLAAIIFAVGIFGYFSQRQTNPLTGEVQHVSLTPAQEVALGLDSAPQMAAQFGGVDADPAAQRAVQQVGEKLVQMSVAGDSDYQFGFHLLADRKTVNAFALPGGPIFITRALYDQLENEAQLAGVLGHEIGHVIERHSAQHMAKSQLAQSIVGAAGVAASDQYGRGQQAAMITAFVAQMAQLRYGRKDELESDRWGVRMMVDAGYDPHALLGVMQILKRASGGGRQPEFFSTHPDPGNREATIRQEIAKLRNASANNGDRGTSY